MSGERRDLSCARIAIIEDDRLLLDSLAIFLRIGGALVETFGTAEEAYRAGGFDRFDAVVCDYLLPGPGGDGLELLRRVREESKDTFTILITAYRGAELPEAARKAGIDRILAKPFRTQDLEEALRACGKGNAAGRAAADATA